MPSLCLKDLNLKIGTAHAVPILANALKQTFSDEREAVDRRIDEYFESKMQHEKIKPTQIREF